MHSVACVGISGRFFTSFSRRCKLIITLRWWSPRMSFSIWELIYFCMQFSKYMSDWSLSVIKNQNHFWSLITGKNQLSQQHCPADWVGVDKLLLIFACIYSWRLRTTLSCVSRLALQIHDSEASFWLLSLFFLNLAATCSPTPSPVQYHRPLGS